MTVGNVLIITPEEEERIKSTYERNEEEIEKDVEDIKEWLKKQSHLPQDEDDLRIKNMLLLNKCSLEKTKKKLDVYYSVKHIVPEIYENREPLHPSITALMDNVLFLPLPRLTTECHRVYVCRFLNDDARDHFIIDFEHAKFGHIVQFTPTNIKKAYTLLEKAYSDRIKGVHFVHLPSSAGAIVHILNSVLSEKIANRVLVHKDFESLQMSIPKEILPSEYNGKAGSMISLYDDWKNYLYSKNDWIKEIGNKRSDENKRIGDKFDSDMFGMCGSFRKLNVD